MNPHLNTIRESLELMCEEMPLTGRQEVNAYNAGNGALHLIPLLQDDLEKLMNALREMDEAYTQLFHAKGTDNYRTASDRMGKAVRVARTLITPENATKGS